MESKKSLHILSEIVMLLFVDRHFNDTILQYLLFRFQYIREDKYRLKFQIRKFHNTAA